MKLRDRFLHLFAWGGLLLLGIPFQAQGVASLAVLRADLERTGLQFFLDNAHPQTGMVRDRAENFVQTPDWNRTASIASTGFGLAVIANAAVRGLVDRKLAEEYALKVLRFARDHVPRRKGWFLHWIDWETGARVWSSEYSTIDTALFMAGALYASQVLSNVPEIGMITRQIYEEIDFFDAMTDGGTRPQKRTLSMAYKDEEGYTPAQWDMYAEQKILLLLGLGHPTQPLPNETWRAFDHKVTALPNGEKVMGIEAPIFIHQYSELFVDFRKFDDGFQNYYSNSLALSAYSRELARRETRYKTLMEGFWGFSAGESPSGYKVWNPLHYSSTVCIGCAAGSIMYLPVLIMQDLASWIDGPYRKQIWGRYGFVDSVDLDQNWFASGVLGITVGPVVLSLADTHEETSIWKDFMRIPEIQKGMERAAEAGRQIQVME